MKASKKVEFDKIPNFKKEHFERYVQLNSMTTRSQEENEEYEWLLPHFHEYFKDLYFDEILEDFRSLLYHRQPSRNGFPTFMLAAQKMAEIGKISYYSGICSWDDYENFHKQMSKLDSIANINRIAKADIEQLERDLLDWQYHIWIAECCTLLKIEGAKTALELYKNQKP